nr:aromatic amino acid lyase [Nitrosomonas nitrosa]
MAVDLGSIVSLNGDSLGIKSLALIARDPRVMVACDIEAMERVSRCSDLVGGLVRGYRAAYESGKRGGDLPNVYGITTGFGEFKSQSLPPDKLLELQASILRSHATGVGDTSDADDRNNYFPAAVVRAALVLRLNTFMKGHSGVRPELVHFVRDMINAGVVPLVPTRGSVGSSGDLCPLAHLFLPLLEEDQSSRFYLVNEVSDVLGNRGPHHSASELGRVITSRLRCHRFSSNQLSPSFARVPKPGPKEGLALTNGAAFSAAGLALTLADAMDLVKIADIAAAMTLFAVCGRTRALDEKIHRVRGMRGQADSAANMLAMLSGGRFTDLSEEVQDVYSLRCAPQVHGASRDAMAYARMVAEAEINAATDNPLFFPDESGPCDATSPDVDTSSADFRAYSAGNFHGQPIGIAADVLAIALAELANISERRTQMLLDRHHNRGLPASLTADPGVQSGFMIAQYCSASLVSENKVLAHPASIDSIPTSANYEDHVAMASIAARKVRTILANTQSTLAIELMIAAQAIDWRVCMHSDPTTNMPLSIGKAASDWRSCAAAFTQKSLEVARHNFRAELSPGVAAALIAIRRVVLPLVEDRVLAEDIRQVRLLIENGNLIDEVESRVGLLRTFPTLCTK